MYTMQQTPKVKDMSKNDVVHKQQACTYTKISWMMETFFEIKVYFKKMCCTLSNYAMHIKCKTSFAAVADSTVGSMEVLLPKDAIYFMCCALDLRFKHPENTPLLCNCTEHISEPYYVIKDFS